MVLLVVIDAAIVVIVFKFVGCYGFSMKRKHVYTFVQSFRTVF